jgi:hypothetical protein
VTYLVDTGWIIDRLANVTVITRKLSEQYLVNDSIVADTGTPSLSAGQLSDSGRSRIIGKSANSLDDAVAVGLRNAR